MSEQLNLYEEYLEKLDGYIEKFFNQQKPYIFCKAGCSLCCSTGEYPFSKLEFEYIKSGIETLSAAEREELTKKITALKEAEAKSIADGEKKFLHTCPFLVDEKCSLYKYRALVCRSFGLMKFYDTEEGEERYLMPKCVDFGLNYSNVYDTKEKVFLKEKIAEINAEFEPLSYNLSLKFLKTNSMANKLDFGDDKALIEWLKEDF